MLSTSKAYIKRLNWKVISHNRRTVWMYTEPKQEVESMKGFTTPAGYMGWVEDRYILFASEYDYREYMED